MPAAFPDPRLARSDIVALGADLEPETLIDAYSRGIFPWPTDELPFLPWFCPDPRAVLFFDELRVPRSLRRLQRRLPLSFSIDKAFERVITECSSAPRPGQDGTWIFPEIIDAYVELHRRGVAHSVEAWMGEELVGGLYGVSAAGAFAGESMFHRESGASKLVLLHLIEHLASRGLDWLDVQVMTPHVEMMGAREISRDSFLELLARERRAGRELFDWKGVVSQSS